MRVYEFVIKVPLSIAVHKDLTAEKLLDIFVGVLIECYPGVLIVEGDTYLLRLSSVQRYVLLRLFGIYFHQFFKRECTLPEYNALFEKFSMTERTGYFFMISRKEYEQHSTYHELAVPVDKKISQKLQELGYIDTDDHNPGTGELKTKMLITETADSRGAMIPLDATGQFYDKSEFLKHFTGEFFDALKQLTDFLTERYFIHPERFFSEISNKSEVSHPRTIICALLRKVFDLRNKEISLLVFGVAPLVSSAFRRHSDILQDADFPGVVDEKTLKYKECFIEGNKILQSAQLGDVRIKNNSNDEKAGI